MSVDRPIAKKKASAALASYEDLFANVAQVIEEARRAAALSVNVVMTATYWLVGRRIVEQEQGGKAKAGYGEALLERLSADLTGQFGRGFSERNLEQMRAFYRGWPIPQTASAELLPRLSAPAGKTRALRETSRSGRARCWRRGRRDATAVKQQKLF
ncbi:MAG TPA: DUF1016 N-terminal domain-containing protein [Kofleriaceae bacterium]|nr:DUF1016 N-terminal domain-containing protein [Kofleriaceae bacterium]